MIYLFGLNSTGVLINLNSFENLGSDFRLELFEVESSLLDTLRLSLFAENLCKYE